MAQVAMQDPRSTKAWSRLEEHARAMANPRLADLLNDKDRFRQFSIGVDNLDLIGDFSRCLATVSVLDDLVALADELQLRQRIAALLDGEMLNRTEQRAALHSALRGTGPVAASPLTDGLPVLEQVAEQQVAFLAFADTVRAGTRAGYSGRPFRHVINIGIGGSDLGPRLVADALAQADSPVTVRFVAGIDGIELQRALADAHPATTLFVICSKTFTTLETRLNAEAARRWLLRELPTAAIGAHFAAVSVNDPAMDAFGIAADARFRIWDWVGGRYSLWSAIGLASAIAIGSENFRQLLSGAAAMDQHFRSAALRSNLPVILGLLAVWQQSFCGVSSHVFLPYDQRLQLLPAYLQQLFMESLGKSVRADGEAVDYATGCPVWGSVGSHSQHSFGQLLQQGTARFQVDYIAAVKGQTQDTLEGHRAGLANMLAQAETLARGQNADEVADALQAAGCSNAERQRLLPHKIHPGNRPSTIILLHELNPISLGALLALYEHQVFVQAMIWGINPFDQWGVEFGKIRAGEYSQSLGSDAPGKLPPIGDYIAHWSR